MRLIFILLILWTCAGREALGNSGGREMEFHLGGALRFNYNFSGWDAGHRRRGGDFGYDVFWLRPKASYKGFLLEAELRFYAASCGGCILRHGWVGYRFSERDRVEVGLTGVPFGILPSGGGNFFLPMPYYVGRGDDADMGVKYCHEDDVWEYAAAFFKNADGLFLSADAETSDDRYGYDVAGRNKEINQWNARVVYKFGQHCRNRAGVSGEFGRLYNLDTRRKGSRFAVALHYMLDWKGWNLRAQLTAYAMYPRNAPGDDPSLVAMTARGATYMVAAKANIYTISCLHAFNLHTRWLKKICLYQDFGLLQKWKSGYRNSVQKVSGLMLAFDPVQVYMDYTMGKRHAWLGTDRQAFGTGWDSRSWHSRFNINIGYYF